MITVVAIYSALFICQQLLFYIVILIFYKNTNYGKKHFYVHIQRGNIHLILMTDIIHSFHAKIMTLFSPNVEFVQYLHICH